MFPFDIVFTTLCVWREARGEGMVGMSAVACVIRNRAAKHGTSCFHEVTKPLQFSSMTAHGDPQLGVYPLDTDPSWALAQKVIVDLMAGATPDLTGGATLYYDDSIGFPKSWDKSKVKFVRQLGKLYFYREV